MRCWPLMLAACLGACLESPTELETSEIEQAGVNMQGVNMQGVNMQGVNMQGVNMQGMTLDGIRFAGATQNGVALTNLRIVKGELLAERNGTTVRGTALAGTELVGQASDATQSTTVEFRISAVAAESGSYDPTGSGNTFLYTLQQWDDSITSWVNACGADQDGRRVAIPLAATWDVTGARIESSELFTFGCTTGVIAKCYRWGYRPWLTGYSENMVDMHQSCTRMARGDYCGMGIPSTRPGTLINVWDQLTPGPIQKRGVALLGIVNLNGMLFEAAWNRDGAVCLSRVRWLLDDLLDGGSLANLCPDRLVGVGLLGETVCDTLNEVLQQPEDALIYNDSYLNLL